MMLKRKTNLGQSAETAMIAGGVVAALAAMASSANPEMPAVANGIFAAGAVISVGGFTLSMFTSLFMAD